MLSTTSQAGPGRLFGLNRPYGAIHWRSEAGIRRPRKRIEQKAEWYRRQGMWYGRRAQVVFRKAIQLADRRNRPFLRFTIPKDLDIVTSSSSPGLRKMHTPGQSGEPRSPAGSNGTTASRRSRRSRSAKRSDLPTNSSSPSRVARDDRDSRASRSSDSPNGAGGSATPRTSEIGETKESEVDEHAAELLLDLAMMLRCLRLLEQLNAERRRLDEELHDLEHGDSGIDALEALLDSIKDRAASAARQLRARDLKDLRARRIDNRRRRRVTEEEVDSQLALLPMFEDHVHELCVDPSSHGAWGDKFRKLLPQVTSDFLDQIGKDYLTRETDRENVSVRQDQDESIHKIERALECAIGYVDRFRAMPDCPWQEMLSAEREVENFRNSLAKAKTKRAAAQAALDKVPQATRARAVRLCKLAKDALVKAGMQSALENFEPADSPPGLEEGEIADLRQDLRLARAAVSDAEWNFNRVRETYNERLEAFEEDLAAARPTDRSTRTDFDQQYFTERNSASRYIGLAEQEYQEVLKRAVAARILTDDDDRHESFVGTSRSARYTGTAADVYKKRLDVQRINRFQQGAKEVDGDADPNHLFPSPSKSQWEPGSRDLEPEDSISQYRIAIGREAQRIREWERQQNVLQSPKSPDT